MRKPKPFYCPTCRKRLAKPCEHDGLYKVTEGPEGIVVSVEPWPAPVTPTVGHWGPVEGVA